MLELFNDMIAQFEALPLPVAIWVNWMGAIFMLAIVFAFNHRPARFALLTFFVFTFIGAGIVFYLTNSIHWIALVHLIVWPPLLIHLINRVIRTSDFNPKSAYGIWVMLLVITMIISLVFDLRDTYNLIMGLTKGSAV